MITRTRKRIRIMNGCRKVDVEDLNEGHTKRI